MSWWAVDVRSREPLREAVATWLVDRTGHAVEEREDGVLVAFTPDEPGAVALGREVIATFGPEVETSSRVLTRTDWTLQWRQGLGPRRLGRLTIAPSWAALPPDAGVVMVIDPETAFGSGEHGSTRAAIRLVEQLLAPGDTVLDLGAGSGILAIAAAKLGARRVIGVEIDPDAIPVAERNAVRNDVADRVAFLEGDAAILAPLLAPADLVVANILRQINIAILPEIRGALRPDGHVVFSGMEVTESALFMPHLSQAGFIRVREVVDEGWWAVAARVA